MLHLMLGNNSSLCAATCHWIELYISHLLYIRPFTTVIFLFLLTLLVFIGQSIVFDVGILFLFNLGSRKLV